MAKVKFTCTTHKKDLRIQALSVIVPSGNLVVTVQCPDGNLIKKIISQATIQKIVRDNAQIHLVQLCAADCAFNDEE